MREPCISALFASQNSEQTIVACITSFLDFADEIIIVDNGSTDNSIKLCEGLQNRFSKVKFYNHPELRDLYENRQVAFEHSKYSWLFRGDTDYVAMDNILELRKKILSTPIKARPVVFQLNQINLIQDIYHTKHEDPLSPCMPRVYSYAKGMKFQRLGRWEGVKYFKDVVCLNINKPDYIKIKTPFWFHCQFKAPMDYFFRGERTNWRELGDFKKFPTLKSYMKYKALRRFGTSDLNKACAIYMEREFFPRLLKYDPEKYVAYSTHIIKNFK